MFYSFQYLICAFETLSMFPQQTPLVKPSLLLCSISELSCGHWSSLLLLGLFWTLIISLQFVTLALKGGYGA